MKKVIFILFSVLVLSSCVSKSKYEDLDSENQRLKRQLSELQQNYDDLEYENNRLRREITDLEDRLYDAEHIIDEAKRTCFIWDDDTFMVLGVLNRY